MTEEQRKLLEQTRASKGLRFQREHSPAESLAEACVAAGWLKEVHGADARRMRHFELTDAGLADLGG